jgi:hypothetical protein
MLRGDKMKRCYMRKEVNDIINKIIDFAKTTNAKNFGFMDRFDLSFSYEGRTYLNPDKNNNEFILTDIKNRRLFNFNKRFNTDIKPEEIMQITSEVLRRI